MDALSEVLRSLQVKSSLLWRFRFTAPWAVGSGGAVGAVFHAVVSGSCWLKMAHTGELYKLNPGDVVLMSHRASHSLSDRPTTVPVALSQVAANQQGILRDLAHGGGGEESYLICGNFSLTPSMSSDLLSLLPPVVHVRNLRGGAAWMEVVVRMLIDEIGSSLPGAELIVDRLTDILVVQLLRAYLESASDEGRGWLAAIRDKNIGQAIALIHREPAASWTAESLAARVGMSRAAFFAKFAALVGEPPARYATRWRLHTATELIRRHDLSLEQVALGVGYTSTDAFSRAFRRQLGLNPSQFRRELLKAAE